jgi:hypothetical protein
MACGNALIGFNAGTLGASAPSATVLRLARFGDRQIQFSLAPISAFE